MWVLRGMCFGKLSHEDGFNFLREITLGGTASVLRDFLNSPTGGGVVWQEQGLGNGDAELFVPNRWPLRAGLPSGQGQPVCPPACGIRTGLVFAFPV